MLAFLARFHAEQFARTGDGAVYVALYWALAGEESEARRWLATAERNRDPLLIQVPGDPALARFADSISPAPGARAS